MHLCDARARTPETNQCLGVHTFLVELNGLVLSPGIVKDALGVATVRAVRLAEHHDGVLVDQLLRLLLSGVHVDR